MGENTKIEWTATMLPTGEKLPGYTFNMWRGCTKVSAGCKNCYAETLSGRNPGTLGVWGPKGRRIVAADAYWRQPLRWNRDAAEAGIRRKVFCASLADVFEGRDTMPEEDRDAVEAARERLWERIDVTTHLDWLLLTKRPENVREMVPPSWWGQGFPANVWIGTSVEDQAAADTRIPELLKVPARVRFLSCEPLLGEVDLGTATGRMRPSPQTGDWYPGTYQPVTVHEMYLHLISWVIAGGESGPGARPMHPDWARSLRMQCQAAGVPFFFKQHGNWLPLASAAEVIGHNKAPLWDWQDGTYSVNIGKHAAGRMLDGREWDEMPEGAA